MNNIIAVSVRLNIYNNIYYIKLTSNGIIYEHLQKLNYVNWYLGDIEERYELSE